MADYPNPLLPIHQRIPTTETIAYDTIEIVSTFGEPQAEYAAIRKAVAMIDQPQRGLIELTGRDRLAFLNNLISNEVFHKDAKQPLAAGRVAPSFLLNLKGRIVCDITVIELGNRTLLEVDVRLVSMLVNLLDRYLFADQVKIASRVGELHQIALHGPRVEELLAMEFAPAPAGTETPQAEARKLIGVDVVLWRDDVCGEPGVHLIAPIAQAASVWNHLLSRHGLEIELGKRLLRPMGWAAFNTARIENGRGLFGIDFELAEPAVPGAKAKPDADEGPRPLGVLPAETGLMDRAVSFTKGCYLGQEIVARMHARQQVARKLIGLRVADDALPFAGQPVLDEAQNQIGVITSSTMSPMRSDAAIALAIVRKPHFEIGRQLRVPAEGAMRVAQVVALPFIGKEENS